MDSALVSHAGDAAWRENALAKFNRTGLLRAPPRVRENHRLEAKITELWGNLNAATYRFLELIAEYDRTRGWELHGLVNCAQWLNWQCGIGKLAAREKVRVARALEQLPRISASFARGEISYSKVRAMTRIATPENESDLLNVARFGTVSHVEKLVRKYRWVERLHEAKKANELHRLRRLRFFYDEDGSMIIHAKLPPEVGAVVKKAIEAAVEALEQEEAADCEPEARAARQPARESAVDPARRDEIWTQSSVSAGTLAGATETPAPSSPNLAARVLGRRPVETPEERHEREHQREHQSFHDAYGARRADALTHLAECFLARRTQARGSVADRYQVVVHIDQRVLSSQAEPSSAPEPQRCELGEIESQRALAIETARRLACDCSVVGIVENEHGEPLSVGRKTRSISPALQRALEARDGGCRYPGCVRTRYCHAHHVVHWADGGETKLSNLATLCVFHHRLVHEGGYAVYRADDGDLVFTRPDGSRVEPNGNHVLSASARIEKINRERGLEIDAGTSRCRWDGGPMDYGMAVEILWRSRETREAPEAGEQARAAGTGETGETGSTHDTGAAREQSFTAPAVESTVPVCETKEASSEAWEKARTPMLVDLVKSLDLANDEKILASLGLTRDKLGGNLVASHQR